MNLAHVHLLLNHFPTIGFAFGLGLFLVGLIGKSEQLKRVSLVVFFLVAAISIPTYLSGNAAQEVLKDRTDVSQPLIRAHEDAALLAFVIMEITGFVAWIGLWQFRLISRVARWNVGTVLLLSLITFGLMARAANIGGEIRHPEIQGAQGAGTPTTAAAAAPAATEPAAAPAAEPPAPAETAAATPPAAAAPAATEHADTPTPAPAEPGAAEPAAAAAAATEAVTTTDEQQPVTGFARSLGAYVTSHTWVWPSCETLHFVGLSLLFTAVLLVDLRMLGIGKAISFAQVYQLLPLGMLGFALNLVTGMFFFIATPEQYTQNIAFYWKIFFVMLGAFNVLYFMLVDEPWKVGPGEDAPMASKIAAASAIVVWVSVLFFGHMLPFLGNAF